jgi:hypothetical protein
VSDDDDDDDDDDGGGDGERGFLAVWSHVAWGARVSCAATKGCGLGGWESRVPQGLAVSALRHGTGRRDGSDSDGAIGVGRRVACWSPATFLYFRVTVTEESRVQQVLIRREVHIYWPFLRKEGMESPGTFSPDLLGTFFTFLGGSVGDRWLALRIPRKWVPQSLLISTKKW